MWVGCNLHHGYTHGCIVSGFLAAGAGGSSSAVLTPSPFANMDAALSILRPPAHIHTGICIQLYSHTWLHSLLWPCVTLSLWYLSWQAPGLMINWTGNCSECSVAPPWFSWVFLTWKLDSGRRGWSVLISCPVWSQDAHPDLAAGKHSHFCDLDASSLSVSPRSPILLN